VVAADIEESAKSAVVAADNDDGFSGDGGRDELSRRLHLFGARDQLPRFTEYAQTLEFGDAGDRYTTRREWLRPARVGRDHRNRTGFVRWKMA